MIGDFIKVAAIVITLSVVVVLLRARLPEYSLLLSIAVVCVVFLFVLSNIFPQIEKMRDLFEKSGNTSLYFGVALKSLGIAYISDFAGSVCRDFGMSALAQLTDIAGKGAIFVLSIPLISAVLQAALKFVGL